MPRPICPGQLCPGAYTQVLVPRWWTQADSLAKCGCSGAAHIRQQPQAGAPWLTTTTQSAGGRTSSR